MGPISIRPWYELIERGFVVGNPGRDSHGWQRNGETFSHAHEVRKRFSPHLLHDLSAVLLDGDFAVLQLESDLFVEQSSHDQLHYFTLLMCELVITCAKLRYVGPIRARQAIAFECLIDRGQEFRITNRLGQKLYRAGFHRAHRGWNIDMASDEDYRKMNASVVQLTLKIQPRKTRHLYVKNQTARRVAWTIALEVLRRSVCFCPLTGRADKILEREKNRRVVINDEDS